jgi:integrase
MGSPKTGFQAACIRAGLGHYDERNKYQGFTWHGLRHTWATWHVQNETPLDVLQKLGGWSDLRMVMNYAHHSPGHLARFANNNLKKETP